MKRGYMRLWAEDLGIAALVSVGQPAMLLAEGRVPPLHAFIERCTKVPHWGPTPACLVGSAQMVEPFPACERRLPLGLREVAEAFPRAVTRNGTYNGRDCVHFDVLADCLEKAGHLSAATELRGLLWTAFAHEGGRVEEALDGSGWIGYSRSFPTLFSIDASAVHCEGGALKHTSA